VSSFRPIPSVVALTALYTAVISGPFVAAYLLGGLTGETGLIMGGGAALTGIVAGLIVRLRPELSRNPKIIFAIAVISALAGFATTYPMIENRGAWSRYATGLDPQTELEAAAELEKLKYEAEGPGHALYAGWAMLQEAIESAETSLRVTQMLADGPEMTSLFDAGTMDNPERTRQMLGFVTKRLEDMRAANAEMDARTLGMRAKINTVWPVARLRGPVCQRRILAPLIDDVFRPVRDLQSHYMTIFAGAKDLFEVALGQKRSNGKSIIPESMARISEILAVRTAISEAATKSMTSQLEVSDALNRNRAAKRLYDAAGATKCGAGY